MPTRDEQCITYMMTASTSDTRRVERTAPHSRSFVLPGNEVGILLVHGFAGSIADLRFFGERLHAARGWTVRGVRLAGHGMTVVDLDRSSVEDWIATARSGLAQLKGSVRSIVVIGESMGALIALRLASEQPSVKGVICLSPAFRVPNERMRSVVTRAVPPGYQWKKTWVDESRASRGSLRAITTRSYSELARFIADERRKAASADIPVLVCLSKNDTIADQQSLDDIRRVFPQRMPEVVIIDEPVHHLNEASAASQLTERMTEFIDTAISNGRN